MLDKNYTVTGSVLRIALLDSDKPTRSGRIYPRAILEKIATDINSKPCTIEEVAPLDRHKKGIPPFTSWPEHAMADSTSAQIENGSLIVDFDIRNNKFGNMLRKTLDAGRVVFKPVGYGDCDASNVITDYTMTYITFGLIDG